MDEPLLSNQINNNNIISNSNSNNSNNNSSDSKKESVLLGFVKKVINNVNEDMDSIDYTINTLLFGHQFDLLFIEHDHSQTLEWQKFIKTANPNIPNSIPKGVQEAVLRNDLGVAALYSQARTKGVGEETFWKKWQFFRFLQDQQSRKKQTTNSSSSTLLPSSSRIEEEKLEEWD